MCEVFRSKKGWRIKSETCIINSILILFINVSYKLCVLEIWQLFPLFPKNQKEGKDWRMKKQKGRGILIPDTEAKRNKERKNEK